MIFIINFILSSAAPVTSIDGGPDIYVSLKSRLDPLRRITYLNWFAKSSSYHHHIVIDYHHHIIHLLEHEAAALRQSPLPG